jgi:hypothetical protein
VDVHKYSGYWIDGKHCAAARYVYTCCCRPCYGALLLLLPLMLMLMMLPLLLLLFMHSVGPGDAAVSAAGSSSAGLPATAAVSSASRASSASQQKPLVGAGAWLHCKLANSRWAQRLLLGATLLMTSMVLADGVLTPSISGPMPAASFQLHTKDCCAAAGAG